MVEQDFPAPISLALGVAGAAVAALVAPTRWIARGHADATLSAALSPTPARAWAVVASVVALVALPVALGFPDARGSCAAALGALFVLAAPVQLLMFLFRRRRRDPLSLQWHDCALYRAAVGGVAASGVLGLAAIPRANGPSWVVAPAVLGLAGSLLLARSVGRRNAVRNRFVRALVAGVDGVTLVPIGRTAPNVPSLAVGAATHVAVRRAAPVVEPGYRDAQGETETPLCLVTAPPRLEPDTSVRAVAAWALVGVMLIAMVAHAAGTR